MRSMMLSLRPMVIATALTLLGTVAVARELKAAPLTPQQRIDSRKMVIWNGSNREVFYDVKGLNPDRAAMYRRLQTLENEENLTENVARLKAIYVENEMQAQTSPVPPLGSPWGYSALSASGYPSAVGTPLQSAIIPYVGNTASTDYVLNTISQVQAAQEELLKAEQALGGPVGQRLNVPAPRARLPQGFVNPEATRALLEQIRQMQKAATAPSAVVKASGTSVRLPSSGSGGVAMEPLPQTNASPTALETASAVTSTALESATAVTPAVASSQSRLVLADADLSASTAKTGNPIGQTVALSATALLVLLWLALAHRQYVALQALGYGGKGMLAPEHISNVKR